MNGLFGSLGMQVFLGTLPLLGAVLWNLLQNERRFAALEARLASFEARLARIEARLDDLFGKLSALAERIAVLEERDRHSPHAALVISEAMGGRAGIVGGR
jgi:chromosome segregation ATPase